MVIIKVQSNRNHNKLHLQVGVNHYHGLKV